MRYVVEIPGTLPTASDHVRMREKSMREAHELELLTIKYLAARFRDAGVKLETKAYIGIIWVRPDMAESPTSVSWPEQFIPDALVFSRSIGNRASARFETFDLGFRTNPTNPRTIIIVADTEHELLRSEELRAYA